MKTPQMGSESSDAWKRILLSPNGTNEGGWLVSGVTNAAAGGPTQGSVLGVGRAEALVAGSTSLGPRKPGQDTSSADAPDPVVLDRDR